MKIWGKLFPAGEISAKALEEEYFFYLFRRDSSYLFYLFLTLNTDDIGVMSGTLQTILGP